MTCTRFAEFARAAELTSIDREPSADAAQRAIAADPTESAIVQAPAGSGKTTLLVERFLNLLAIVDRPEEILAITFTRKAAAEMRQRIRSALESSDARAEAIRLRAIALNWRLAEQPGRLQVQTIDGFCAGLVRNLPITSAFGDRTRIVEDAASIYRVAIERTFTVADAFTTELVDVFALFDNDYAQARTALGAMLARRDQWLEVVAAVLAGPKGSKDLERTRTDSIAEAVRAAVLQLQTNAFADVEAQLDPELTQRLLRIVRGRAMALGLEWPWTGLPDALGGWQFIADLVATRDATPRTRLGATQGFKSDDPHAVEQKAALRDLIRDLDQLDAIRPIAALRLLPSVERNPEDAHAMVAVATTLAITFVNLAESFRSAGVADFTELTFAALRALGSPDSPTDLALALDYRIKHVLVDEFQDTSAIQHRLLTRLIQEWQPQDGRTFFAVGDPMQSIYRFRDADVALFQRTRRNGIGLLRPQPIRLRANFRTSAPLVDWCNRTFERALGKAEDPILGQVAFSPSTPTRPSRPDDGCTMRVLVSNEPAEHDEASVVCSTIEQLRTNRPGESIAVLARTRAHLSTLLAHLDSRGIVWTGTDIQSLVEQPVIDDLLSLLRALLSHDDLRAWLALLRAPFIGLSLRDLESMAAATHVARGVLEGERDDLLSADARARLHRVRPVLSHAIRLRGQRTVRHWLEATFIRLGGADAYADSDAMRHAERLFQLIDEHHTRRVDLEALERSLAQLYAEPQPRPDPVAVMTIHKAKGLEFDHVLMPSLHRVGRVDDPPPIRWRAEGGHVLIGVNRAGRPDDVYRWLQFEERARSTNELIRLFYVAATRARHSLHLFGVLGGDAVDLREPPSGSLLGTVWPFVRNAAQRVVPGREGASGGQTERVRGVLPADYEWTPGA